MSSTERTAQGATEVSRSAEVGPPRPRPGSGRHRPSPHGRPRRVATRLLSTRVARQSVGYTAASLLATIAGGIGTVVVARLMSVGHYAVFSFSNSVLGLLSMFFEFGLLVPVSRRLPLVERAERREILSAATLVLCILATAFSVTVYGASYVVDEAFTVHAGHALRVSAIVSAGWALTQGCLMLAQGVGRLGSYSVALLGSKLLFLAGLGVLAIMNLRFTPAVTLIVESVTLALPFVVLLVRLRPGSFSGGVAQLPRLFREAREYGLAVYVGRVLSSGTYNMDVLMVGWFASASSVAFYTLAGSVALPVSLLPTGLAMALFGDMARKPRLQRRWLVVVAATSVGGVVLAGALAYPFVHIALGRRYSSVVVLVPILALAQGINGFTRVFNTYLWAHGRGSELRTASIALAVSNVALNFALIPAFGAAGAAWASVLALVINLAFHVRFYRQVVRTEPRQAAFQ